MLKQSSGETATSQTATFDTANNTAVLEGDVVLMQGDDKKAVGDRVDYDQKAQTMVLTGPVVVTQGANVLKGRRLVFHRATEQIATHFTGRCRGRPNYGTFREARVKASLKEADDDQSATAFRSGRRSRPIRIRRTTCWRTGSTSMTWPKRPYLPAMFPPCRAIYRCGHQN